MGTNKDNLTARFAEGLSAVTAVLSGRDAGLLAGDIAVKHCADHPVPVVSAAMSLTAVRRAAAAGAGLLYAGVSSHEHCRDMTDAYRTAGGNGPIILVRRVAVGEGDTFSHGRQVDLYRTYTSDAAQSKWAANQLTDGTPEAIADSLRADMAATGADSLNLRVHVPGVSPEAALGHIAGLEAVLARLR
jgi:hypothetical protein